MIHYRVIRQSINPLQAVEDIVGETVMPEELDDLEPFVGQWRMTPRFTPNASDVAHALTTFEWLAGRRFLIQRWEIEHPDAPDGIAIIGFDRARLTYLQHYFDRARLTYLQHYFDSRGVVRVYDMGFTNSVWTLQRIAEHPDFSQRFIGRFREGGRSIEGSWERSNDGGSSWSLDFDLTYTRVD
jgi:hypothetical protein